MEEMQKGMEKGQKEGDGEQGEKGEPKGEGGQQGQSGDNGEGGDGEGNAEMLYEIYKEQRMLREALQKRLEKEGLGGAGQNASKQMEDVEKQLLNKRFDTTVLQRMQNLKHELLKLEKAIREIGRASCRE